MVEEVKFHTFVIFAWTGDEWSDSFSGCFFPRKPKNSMDRRLVWLH
jgi:hypothetical protein